MNAIFENITYFNVKLFLQILCKKTLESPFSCPKGIALLEILLQRLAYLSTSPTDTRNVLLDIKIFSTTFWFM